MAIHVRADSGFGGPEVYDMLESFANVSYTIALKLNDRTKKLSQSLLEQTIAEQAGSGQDQVNYMPIAGYKSSFWNNASRNLIIKCEATAHSTSRRTLISNRPELPDNPELVYRMYAQRGESENRNKELKCGLSGDRLSDHRYMANLFRIMMHCLSHNMLVTLRRIVAVPEPTSIAIHDPPASNKPLKETQADRKVHNDRRKRDALGEGHPCTWRTHVIKVAARIIVSTRRVVLELSASWPHLKYFQQVAAAIDRFEPLKQ